MGLRFVVFCSVLVVLVLHIAVLAWLVLPRRGSRKEEAREIGGDGGAMMPAVQGCDPQSSGARGRPDGVYGPVTKPIIIVLFVVMAVGLLMMVLAPANGSCEERVGSMLVDIGSFLTSLMICFVIFPNSAIQLIADWAALRNKCVTFTSLCICLSFLES
uniref:Uncharacterized protein n=1 Tax=Arundo donax TaxID=35708 RepID=A0A0A8ZX95_ARUDO